MASKRSRSREWERKRKQRANLSENEKNRRKEIDRQQKRKEKDKKEDVVKEFEKIELKHRIRSLRSKRSEEEKIEQNLKAKEGMKNVCDKLGLSCAKLSPAQ